jgi:transposase
MDRRWQLVLDCLDAERPPCSKGTLVAFRPWLIAHDLDRRLIERTIAVAAQTGAFSPRALRAALDSSPLWGAARVEDTYNLLGHALRKALGVLARQQGRGLAEIAADAGAPGLAASSLKAALDLDWDDPAARAAALARVLAALEAVEAYVAAAPAAPAARAAVAVAHRVRDQDVETGPDGAPELRRGVAPDRRVSVEDGAMRHGRKSKSQRVDGYKRHALRDLDLGVVRAVGLTAANEPDAAATDALQADLARQGARLAEVHIDRGYLSSRLVRDRPPDLAVYCKAWPVRNADRFPKTAFALDWDTGMLTCPAGQALPFEPGGVVQFPAATCAACPLRARCTTSPHGRSVAIHPDERLLAELRARQATAAGRAKLRERVAAEHSLAHLGRWQGRRARYVGQRKNLFDLRRSAVVHNLHVLARLSAAQPAAA